MVRAQTNIVLDKSPIQKATQSSLNRERAPYCLRDRLPLPLEDSFSEKAVSREASGKRAQARRGKRRSVVVDREVFRRAVLERAAQVHRGAMVFCFNT